jgi:hypothetical protein
MSHRLIAPLLLLATLGLTAASVAQSQSVADADNTMHAMDMRMRALTAARKSLQQIEHHSTDREAHAVREITDADVSVVTAAVKVFTVAFMLTGVKSPEDVRFAQRQFGLVVALFVTTAETELSRVDANLHDITTPATLLDAVKIRDAIVELRDFLRPFASQP